MEDQACVGDTICEENAWDTQSQAPGLINLCKYWKSSTCLPALELHSDQITIIHNHSISILSTPNNQM
jgi:hypothetical protein